MYQRVQRKPGKPQMRAGFSILCMLATIVTADIMTYFEKYYDIILYLYCLFVMKATMILGYFPNKWISGPVNSL